MQGVVGHDTGPLVGKIFGIEDLRIGDLASASKDFSGGKLKRLLPWARFRLEQEQIRIDENAFGRRSFSVLQITEIAALPTRMANEPKHYY